MRSLSLSLFFSSAPHCVGVVVFGGGGGGESVYSQLNHFALAPLCPLGRSGTLLVRFVSPERTAKSYFSPLFFSSFLLCCLLFFFFFSSREQKSVQATTIVARAQVGSLTFAQLKPQRGAGGRSKGAIVSLVQSSLGLLPVLRLSLGPFMGRFGRKRSHLEQIECAVDTKSFDPLAAARLLTPSARILIKQPACFAANQPASQ